MWTKKDHDLYFKTDEMDKINIIYDYFFLDDNDNNDNDNNNSKQNNEINDNIRYDSDVLFLYKDVSTILVFANKKSEKEKIQFHKDYIMRFILSGFVIESSTITNKDLNFFKQIQDNKLKQNYNLIKKYSIIHGNSINIIGYN